jgi:hypothetical protein
MYWCVTVILLTNIVVFTGIVSGESDDERRLQVSTDML